MITPFQLTLYALSWLSVIYLFNCILAKHLIKPQIQPILLYGSTIMLLGVFGEVLIGSLYQTIFQTKLWEYRAAPIHNSHTSLYSIFIWFFYGLHLWLLHSNFNKENKLSKISFPLLLGFEALIVEILVNLTYLSLTGTYIFYYFPSDMFHLTSVQAIPIYILAGYIIPKVIRKMESNHRFFITLNTILVLIFTLLT